MNNSTKLNSIKWLYYLSLRYYEIVYVYGLHVCTCTMFQKRLLGPCYWIYKWLWATMQVPGTKPGLPAKAARALYHWAMASPITYILVTYFSISMTLDVIISSSHMQCCMNFLSKPWSLFLYVHVNLEIIESESLFCCFLFVYVQVSAYVWNPGVDVRCLFQWLSTSSLRQDLSRNPELTNLTKLAGQQAPGVSFFFFLPFQGLGLQVHAALLAFYVGPEVGAL